jgi:hypothetical protein
MSALYLFFFLLRRMIACILLVYCRKLLVFQFIVMFLTSMISLGYLIKYRPLQTTFDNNNEIFNEFCVYIISTYSYVFIDADVGGEAKNTTGWLMILLVSFNVVYGLFIVLFTTTVEVVVIIKDYYSNYRQNK